MKKSIIAFLVIYLMSYAPTIFAHEHHHDAQNISKTDSLMQIEMAEHQQMEAVNAFPNYHPLIVHFPITPNAGYARGARGVSGCLNGDDVR